MAAEKEFSYGKFLLRRFIGIGISIVAFVLYVWLKPMFTDSYRENTLEEKSEILQKYASDSQISDAKALEYIANSCSFLSSRVKILKNASQSYTLNISLSKSERVYTSEIENFLKDVKLDFISIAVCVIKYGSSRKLEKINWSIGVREDKPRSANLAMIFYEGEVLARDILQVPKISKHWQDKHLMDYIDKFKIIKDNSSEFSIISKQR